MKGIRRTKVRTKKKKMSEGWGECEFVTAREELWRREAEEAKNYSMVAFRVQVGESLWDTMVDGEWIRGFGDFS